MSDVRHIIARGKTLTGRKLRQAIESATGTLIGGRGIRISTVNGHTTVSITGHTPRARSGLDGFLVSLTSHVLIDDNRWSYQWAQIVFDAESTDFVFVPDGRTSTVSGPALNFAEWDNNEFRAFHGVNISSFSDTLEVLPITTGQMFTSTPIIMYRMGQINSLAIVPPKKKGDPPLPIDGLYWFYAMNGAQVQCPAAAVAAPESDLLS